MLGLGLSENKLWKDGHIFIKLEKLETSGTIWYLNEYIVIVGILSIYTCSMIFNSIVYNFSGLNISPDEAAISFHKMSATFIQC